jgi:uncharacterized protein (UPF0147 family)
VGLDNQQIKKTGNSIYQDFARNRRQYQVSNATLIDILNHVINDPADIVQTHWSQQFNVVSAIVFFNKLPYMNPVNAGTGTD